jgi:hypothetical protein
MRPARSPEDVALAVDIFEAAQCKIKGLAFQDEIDPN